MIRGLLILAIASSLWAWDPADGAEGYLFCWSLDPTYWTLAQCTDVGPEVGYDSAVIDRLWGFGGRRPSGWRVFVWFLQVVPYDAVGNIGNAGLSGANYPLEPSPVVLP